MNRVINQIQYRAMINDQKLGETKKKLFATSKAFLSGAVA